jgi:Ca-activated chloride channel family protein
MKRSVHVLLLALAVSLMAGAQTRPGSIKGKVTDKTSGEAMAFATVVVKLKDKLITGTNADADGNYFIQNVAPGTYTLECSYAGYATVKKSNIKVLANKPIVINFALEAANKLLEEVVVVDEADLIELGKTSDIVEADEIKNLPYRNVGQVISTSAGVYSGQDFNTEEYTYIAENGYKKPTAEPLSTFSIDVDGASYANARRYLKDGSLPPVDAVRVEECINYFSYEYPEPSGEDPFSITTELAESPWNEGHYLLHIGLKGMEKPTEEMPRNNLVFLLDVSGSMQAYNKLELVKKSLKMLVNQLNDDDRIAIVVYAGASGLALPSTKVANKQRVLETLDRLRAGGSTAGAEGIQLAYKVANENFVKNGNNRIILCTDGDFNVGISSQSELVRLIEGKRDNGIFLSVFGFGMGNLKDNKMEQLANHGNGTYNYIDNLNEAQKVFVNEAGSTLLTIAKDVKIQVEFNPENVAAYRLIGYENRLLNAEDFNNDKKDAGEIGAGHTVTAIYEIVPLGVKMPEGLSVDPLKYQKAEKRNVKLGAELATVKFRYKQPMGSKSKLLSVVVKNQPQSFKQSSTNMRFSAAVASWAMLLRNSPFQGNTSYDSILDWSLTSRGTDEFGYRGEFIQLVRLSKELDKRALSSTD